MEDSQRLTGIVGFVDKLEESGQVRYTRRWLMDFRMVGSSFGIGFLDVFKESESLGTRKERDKLWIDQILSLRGLHSPVL